MEEKSLVRSHSSDLAMDYGHHPSNVVGIFFRSLFLSKDFLVDGSPHLGHKRERGKESYVHLSFSYYFNQTDRFTTCLNACFLNMAWHGFSCEILRDLGR